jgi:hypothetical protein
MAMESSDCPQSPYGATHHPHLVLGTVGNTADISFDARAVQSF